jgi:hypothetical protein
MDLDRRAAIVSVAALIGYLHGKPVAGQSGQAINLSLDGIDGIVLRYRGRTVIVTPGQIMDALGK